MLSFWVAKSHARRKYDGVAKIGSMSAEPGDDNQPQASVETVAAATLGSFLEYLSGTETVVTPYLAGFFNVEGGHLGIASELLESCESCQGISDESVLVDCDVCGRHPGNYLHLRAGRGDGVYPVFEMAWGAQFAGTMCLLNDLDFVNRFASLVTEVSEKRSPLSAYPELFWEELQTYPHDLELSYVGTLDGVADSIFWSDSGWTVSTYYFADAGVGVQPRGAIVTASNTPLGQQNVYTFSYRDHDNGDILVPLLVLTLETGLAEEIGLPNQPGSVDWSEEARKWSTATVFAAIGGERVSAVAEINSRYYLSWVVQGELNQQEETDYTVKGVSWAAHRDLQSNGQLSESVQQYLERLPPILQGQLLMMRGFKQEASEYYDFGFDDAAKHRQRVLDFLTHNYGPVEPQGDEESNFFVCRYQKKEPNSSTQRNFFFYGFLGKEFLEIQVPCALVDEVSAEDFLEFPSLWGRGRRGQALTLRNTVSTQLVEKHEVHALVMIDQLILDARNYEAELAGLEPPTDLFSDRPWSDE